VSAPVPPIIAVAVIAAAEGLGLIGYGIYDLVNGVQSGATGPEEVSNVPAIILLIVIQLLFGVGLLLIAHGWWMSRRWARSPFLVAQILAVLVGYDLAQSSGTAERTVGIAFAIIAIVGIVLAFMPAVARAIEP